MARELELAAQNAPAFHKGRGAPLIGTINLTVEFGAQRALDRVSFSLRSGEIVGLVGANGAGKSTFGRVEARNLCERLIAALGIVTNGPDQPIESLSGGNQQKVLLARAMVNSPTILLLDEPTRGIDVGAKQDVYRWIRETAATGAVIVVSSLEEEELISLADRILVLRDGQKMALLEAGHTSAKELLLLTAGGPRH